MGLAGDMLSFQKGQLFQTPFIPTDASLAGQTVIITGANGGLGFEAAKHIYNLNVSHLIFAVRSPSKGEEARSRILASGPETGATIEVWDLDMSKYASVIAFAERMRSLPRVDVLIANAGIDVQHFERFEGHESTVTVNVISTMLLCALAVPKMQESARETGSTGRIVLTGSAVHIWAPRKELEEAKEGEIFVKLDDEKSAAMGGRYFLSKLLLLLAWREFSKTLSASAKDEQVSVAVSCVNPGWCKTDLFRTNDGGFGGRMALKAMGRTAEEGSRTLVHAAVAGQETHGQYLSESQAKPTSTWARSEDGMAIGRRVWKELVNILENIQPGVMSS